MSLTADLAPKNQRVIGGNVDPTRRDRGVEPEADVVEVTCGACGASQPASGRALGYTCNTCGESWRVLKCRECRKASLVLDGVTACPRCGHDHQTKPKALDVRTPAWLTEPVPLSIWLGSVKYLGGHAERDQPVSAAGLLLDRRGVHLRAFAELFSMEWTSVRGVDIEGPQDISERLTTSHLIALGASTWAMQVSYLTVRTTNGDAIFEVDGLNPPELHARMSRVIQGLKQSERLHAPVEIERPTSTEPPTARTTALPTVAPASPPPPSAPPTHPSDWVEPPAAFEPPIMVDLTTEPPASNGAAPLALDVQSSETPLEILVIDALWKLAHLREVGLLDQVEMEALRARVMARIPDLTEPGGPLLHV